MTVTRYQELLAASSPGLQQQQRQQAAGEQLDCARRNGVNPDQPHPQPNPHLAQQRQYDRGAEHVLQRRSNMPAQKVPHGQKLAPRLRPRPLQGPEKHAMAFPDIEREVFRIIDMMRERGPSAKAVQMTAKDTAAHFNEVAELLRHEAAIEPGRWAAGIFHGPGIVFSVPPVEDSMLLVLTSVVHLRETLGCRMPIEVFVGSFKAGAGVLPGWTIPLSWEVPYRLLAEMPNVHLRAIGADLTGRLSPDNRFIWKLMAMLLSAFSEVLMLDEDNLPLQEPFKLFRFAREWRLTGLFWPDIWPVNQQAPIWDHIPGRHPKTRRGLSQEAGQLLVNKAAGGMTPLLLATYMNMFPRHFFPNLYCQYGSEGPDGSCHPKRRPHGAGDKDTFLVAWSIMEQPYHFMPTPAFYSVPSSPPHCAVAQLAMDETGEPIFLHHNLRKLVPPHVPTVVRLGETFLPGMLAGRLGPWPDLHAHRPSDAMPLEGIICQRTADAEFELPHGAHSNGFSLQRHPGRDHMLCIHMPHPETMPCEKMFRRDFLSDIRRTLLRIHSAVAQPQ